MNHVSTTSLLPKTAKGSFNCLLCRVNHKHNQCNRLKKCKETARSVFYISY
ncbi:hypothetical protein PROSTU_02742 [Providencia stuartii ATCC 25827]|uniref:Uncharacterized protein n=1 Tax=Providencia stuartii ATCC 25827 TaxID=471874 RepID=A0AA87CUF2_PROST|nr:hypothetical protein PROSTU_02742 [Providencia stuartii ATCC 25827]